MDDLEEFLSGFAVFDNTSNKTRVEDAGGCPSEFLDAVISVRPIVEGRLSVIGDVQALLRLAEPLESAANEAGIHNVFDDGGFRTLLMTRLFGLRPVPGKAGDDAIDPHGRRVELKTVNLRSSRGELKSKPPGVTTEHSLRRTSIERYRTLDVWLIGVFRGNHPLEVWEVESSSLEPWYQKWEEALASVGVLNNPKIPFKFIEEHGRCHKLAV